MDSIELIKLPEDDFVYMTEQDMEYDGGSLSSTFRNFILPAGMIALSA